MVYGVNNSTVPDETISDGEDVSLSQFALPLDMMPADITAMIRVILSEYGDDGAGRIFTIISKMSESHPNEMPTPVVPPSPEWINSFRNYLNEELGSASGDAGTAMADTDVDTDTTADTDDTTGTSEPYVPDVEPIVPEQDPFTPPLDDPPETGDEEPTANHPDAEEPQEIVIVQQPIQAAPPLEYIPEWYENKGVWAGVAGSVLALGILSYFILSRRK